MSIPDSLNKWTLSNYPDFREDKHCGICLEKGEGESKIVYHSFGNQSSKERHEFHRNCINQWIDTSSSDKCPTCKKIIKFRSGVGIMTAKEKKLRDAETTLILIAGILEGCVIMDISRDGYDYFNPIRKATIVLTIGVAIAAILGVIGIKAMRYFELG